MRDQVHFGGRRRSIDLPFDAFLHPSIDIPALY